MANSPKIPLQHGLFFSKYNLWYCKTGPSQNQDLSTSLERPYKELLNELFSFEIHHSELKWVVKERPQN